LNVFCRADTGYIRIDFYDNSRLDEFYRITKDDYYGNKEEDQKASEKENLHNDDIRDLELAYEIYGSVARLANTESEKMLVIPPNQQNEMIKETIVSIGGISFEPALANVRRFGCKDIDSQDKPRHLQRGTRSFRSRSDK